MAMRMKSGGQRMRMRIVGGSALVACLVLGCGASQRQQYAANKKEALSERNQCTHQCDLVFDRERAANRTYSLAPLNHANECNAACFDAYRDKKASVEDPDDGCCVADRSGDRGWNGRAPTLDSSPTPYEFPPTPYGNAQPVINGGTPRPQYDRGTYVSHVSNNECVDEIHGPSVPVRVTFNVPYQEQKISVGLTVPHEAPREWTISFREDFAGFSPTFQRFAFAHECGHVNSGDPGSDNENAANCWAARRLTREHAMNQSDWVEVRRVLTEAYQRQVGNMPPGPEQMIRMQRCIDTMPAE